MDVRETVAMLSHHVRQHVGGGPTLQDVKEVHCRDEALCEVEHILEILSQEAYLPCVGPQHLKGDATPATTDRFDFQANALDTT